MNAEIIYDSPFATMWFYPETKIIHHQTHANQGSWHADEFRKMMMLGSHTLSQKGAQKWLSDDRNSLAVNKEEFKWGQEFWFPETVKAGWKHWAVIQPKHIIVQLNLEKAVKEYKNKGINVQYFSDVDEGMKWLESQ